MSRNRFLLALLFAFLPIVLQSASGWCQVRVSRSSVSDSQIAIEAQQDAIEIRWPTGGGQYGYVKLDLRPQQPLVETIGLQRHPGGDVAEILERMQPAIFLTEGTRGVPPGKPADQTWQVFFDNPGSRPHQTHLAKLSLEEVHIDQQTRRAAVTLSKVSAGSFTGTLQFNFYADCALLHVEGVLRTAEDRRAILYDAGMLAADKPWQNTAWSQSNGDLVRKPLKENEPAQPIKVRHRALYIETDNGTLACFPPPHQFFYPVDWSDNLGYVWQGRGHHALTEQVGFGIRQDKTGRNNFLPWFNAPPERDHRLGVFYLLSPGGAEDARRATLEFTHGDRFPDLPGYRTMTSHYHMALAVTAMQQRAAGHDPPPEPEVVQVFKDMNVEIVHLGEFHGDGHQQDPGPLRLPELDAMFDVCRRHSDEQLLLIPGEEVNRFLGLELEGKHPGHWMSLFPRPVYWTMQRGPDQPFVEEHAEYGRVYHVGSRADMVRLLREENGLVWAAHPRIKASSWTPDIFRNEDFFIAEFWLGGAWKAMPGDLSDPRLGTRVLSLLDDMANWGHKKYVLGEVDVFKIDNTHELYGHMNINYLQLDSIPRYEDGWQAVLDALRDGKFFVTTGEILMPHFSIDGKTSGQNLEMTRESDPVLLAELRWTFPLKWAEVISGDGQRIYRERIDLSHTAAHGEDTLTFAPALAGRHWARLEVWDVAGNGAFSQPIWILQR